MSMTSRRMNWASAPTQSNEADRYPRARHLGTPRAGGDGPRATNPRAAGPRAAEPRATEPRAAGPRACGTGAARDSAGPAGALQELQRAAPRTILRELQP